MSQPQDEPRQPGDKLRISAEEALVKYTAEDAVAVGLPSPGALNLLNVFCKQITGSPLLPKALANSPNPGATLLSVIVTGREFGFTPMQAIRSFWLSPDGRLGLYGAAMMGRMRSAGVKFEFLKDDDDGCEIKATRKDGETYTSTFTHEDAVRAALYDRNQSLYPKYPRRMCKWRCVSDIWNTLCPDLGGGGPVYTTEELQEEAKERGDVSDRAFREQARFAEPNPYHVGDNQAMAPEGTVITVGVDPVPQGSSVTLTPEQMERWAASAEVPVGVKQAAAGVASPVAQEPQPTPPPIPIPPAPKPEPAPEPAPVNEAPAPARPAASDQVKAAVRALTDLIPKMNPETLTKKLSEFAKGFLAVNKVPWSEAERVMPVIRFAEAILKDNPNLIVNNPNANGSAIGTSWRAFLKKLDGWNFSDRCKAYAVSLMFSWHHQESGGEDTAVYLGPDVTNACDLAESDMFAFLQVANKTREAIRLLDYARSTKKRVSAVVADWGGDVDAADPKQVERLVMALRIPPKPEPQPVPNEPPAQAPDDLSFMNLFEEEEEPAQ